MTFVHRSWHWLSTRVAPGKIWNSDHAAPARPCLPQAETLDDRILFTGTPVDFNEVEIADPTQVLIGLIQGQYKLVEAQLDGLLKFASSKLESKITLAHKFAQESLDVNSVFQKYGEALMTGALQSKQPIDYAYKLKVEIDDLYKLANKFGGEKDSLLLPAVQKIEEVAQSAFDSLLNKGGAKPPSFSPESLKILLKVEDVFGKIDDLLLKTAADVLTGGAYKGESAGPLAKFDVLTSKINKLQLDGNFKAVVVANIAGFHGLLEDTLGEKGDDGGDGGGPILTLTQTDDIISEG